MSVLPVGRSLETIYPGGGTWAFISWRSVLNADSVGKPSETSRPSRHTWEVTQERSPMSATTVGRPSASVRTSMCTEGYTLGRSPMNAWPAGKPSVTIRPSGATWKLTGVRSSLCHRCGKDSNDTSFLKKNMRTQIGREPDRCQEGRKLWGTHLTGHKLLTWEKSSLYKNCGKTWIFPCHIGTMWELTVVEKMYMWGVRKPSVYM